MKIEKASERAQFSRDKLTKTSLFETSRFFLDVHGLEPGQEHRAHSHADSDKVYYVVEGEGDFSVAGETARLGPGEATLAPRGVDHGVSNPGPARLKVLVFMAPHPKPPAEG